MKKVTTLVRKEWSEIFKNRFVLFTVSFIPLIFTALPLIILYGITSSGEGAGIPFGELPPQYLDLCRGLNSADCEQYVIIVQFMLMFMMLPVLIPITIASYSIVGEKATRTLEPLLATPITTAELLAGKGLAAVIPAVAATWVSYLTYALGARLMGVQPALIAKFFDPLWLLAIFVVGPLLAVAGVSIAVMISSRTSDPRVAEQISGLFVLPIVGLLVAQAAGIFLIDQTIILWMAAGLVMLNAGLLYFAVQLFQRETILTRWK